MASLDEIWARFSLTEEEEGGAEVPKDAEESVYRLAGRFYTKRVLNVDAVARTFKPLWRTTGELKIRDIGEHILLFEFKDVLDLSECWSSNHGHTINILWHLNVFSTSSQCHSWISLTLPFGFRYTIFQRGV